MNKTEVIEIARGVGVVVELGFASVFTHKELADFANEVERKTLERAAEVAKPHWRIAENIRALKEST